MGVVRHQSKHQSIQDECCTSASNPLKQVLLCSVTPIETEMHCHNDTLFKRANMTSVYLLQTWLHTCLQLHVILIALINMRLYYQLSLLMKYVQS